MWDKLHQKWQYLEFGRKQQLAFLEDLSALVKDGVPANQAVKVMQDTTKGIFKEVAMGINERIGQGQPVATGMEKWFSPATVEIVRAGESSGTLAEAIESAAASLAQQTNALVEFVNSTLYPFVIFASSLVMLVFIKSSVLTNFADIKPVSTWPGVGQNLYYTASFLDNWWWLILLVLIGFFMALWEMLTQLVGPSRKYVDQVPLLSLYRETTAARFMETLGLLLSNGVTLNKSLRIMHQDAQPYLAWHLWMMEIRLSGGKENIADVLDTDLIGEEDLMRLKVVAKGKGFEHALLSLGKKANRLAAKKIIVSGKVVGALFLMLGALMAATVVFGIYTIGSIIAA